MEARKPKRHTVLKLRKCNASQKLDLACQLFLACPPRPGTLPTGSSFLLRPSEPSPSRLSLQFAIPGPGHLRYYTAHSTTTLSALPISSIAPRGPIPSPSCCAHHCDP